MFSYINKMELSHANLRVDTYGYTICDNFKI